MARCSLQRAPLPKRMSELYDRVLSRGGSLPKRPVVPSPRSFQAKAFRWNSIVKRVRLGAMLASASAAAKRCLSYTIKFHLKAVPCQSPPLFPVPEAFKQKPLDGTLSYSEFGLARCSLQRAPLPKRCLSYTIKFHLKAVPCQSPPLFPVPEAFKQKPLDGTLSYSEFGLARCSLQRAALPKRMSELYDRVPSKGGSLPKAPRCSQYQKLSSKSL